MSSAQAMTRRQRDELPTLSCDLTADDWKTPNSYSNDIFEVIPDRSGIYLFVEFDHRAPSFLSLTPLYIGMSLHLSRRVVGGHEVRREIERRACGFIHTWFKEFPPAVLRERERYYIQLFRPKFNIMGRAHGEDWRA